MAEGGRQADLEAVRSAREVLRRLFGEDARLRPGEVSLETADWVLEIAEGVLKYQGPEAPPPEGKAACLSAPGSHCRDGEHCRCPGCHAAGRSSRFRDMSAGEGKET